MLPYVPLAQLIAYTCLTVTSVIVAIVSLRFSYRQNFGWPPLLLVSTHGMEQEFGDGKDESVTRAVVEFEVWNRRTYPVVLEGVEVHFHQPIFARDRPVDDSYSEWWISPDDTCYYGERLVVKNGERHDFKMSLPMKRGQSLDTIDDMIEIDVTCFDPRREKTYQLKQKYRYHFKPAK
jgi:hypothetical protein